MSEDAKNKQCQICKGYLFEDDDIVVCPQCGAPHHRDCWQTVGHCGVEELHGTDSQYDLAMGKKSEKTEASDEAELHVCPRCRKTAKAENAQFCPYCGQAYETNHGGSANGATFQNGANPFDPYGGLPKNTTIDGVRVEDIATFVGSGSARYINRFSALNKNKKGSWNWAAFIFPSGWCFARKMVPAGILYLIMQIAASLCMLPFSNALNDLAVTNDLGSSAEIVTFIMSNYDKVSLLPMLLAFVGTALLFVPRIICGRLGDWHYKCFAVDKIKKILDDSTVDDKATALRRGGNVSIWLLAIAFFIAEWLPTIIFSLI